MRVGAGDGKGVEGDVEGNGVDGDCDGIGVVGAEVDGDMVGGEVDGCSVGVTELDGALVIRGAQISCPDAFSIHTRS